MTLVALLLGLPACGSVGGGGGPECLPAGTAEVCLSKGSTPEITAKGLEPGSQVIALETREGGGAPGQPPPATAGQDGSFPADGGTLTLAEGKGPLTLLVTVRPRGGKPTTVTFRRT